MSPTYGTPVRMLCFPASCRSNLHKGSAGVMIVWIVSSWIRIGRRKRRVCLPCSICANAQLKKEEDELEE